MITADDFLYSKFKFIEVTNSSLLQSIGDYYFDITFEGQLHGGAQFFLAPADQSMDIEPAVGGSCFALLQYIFSQSNQQLTTENLEAFLQSQSSDFVSTIKNDLASLPVESSKNQLILSFGNGSNFCLFPANDFAFVVVENRIYGCTVSDLDNERVFFTIEFRDQVLDREVVSCLKSFMSNPCKAISVQAEHSLNKDSANILNSPSASGIKKSSSDVTLGKERRCLNCFCSSTPMWRRGPDGVASLCNACGVKWKSGKLVMDQATIEANSQKIKFELGLLQESE